MKRCVSSGYSCSFNKIKNLFFSRADIISLQEVETEQFYNFFQPELRRDGYEGVFSPKSRAKTMNEVERKHVDGCAIFYRFAIMSGLMTAKVLMKHSYVQAFASLDGLKLPHNLKRQFKWHKYMLIHVFYLLIS